LGKEITDAHAPHDSLRYARAWKALLSLSRLFFHSRKIMGGRVRKAHWCSPSDIAWACFSVESGRLHGADSSLTMDVTSPQARTTSAAAKLAEVQTFLPAGEMSKALR
jgi:hypothetical protein